MSKDVKSNKHLETSEYDTSIFDRIKAEVIEIEE